MRRARSTLPGAGYSISYSARGKPPKSWIVRGFGCAVRYVPFTNQCAEIATMALGFGTRPRNAANPRLKRLSSIAFIGEPWPTNTTGIRSVRAVLGPALVSSGFVIAFPSGRPLEPERPHPRVRAAAAPEARGRKRPRRSMPASSRDLRGRGAHGLHLDLDVDALADENAARLERLIPLEAVVAPVEGRRRGEGGPLVAPGILGDA